MALRVFSHWKQSIEANLGSDNVVIIDIQQMTNDELNNITYFATGISRRLGLNNNLGWSPDYLDPSYLEVLALDWWSVDRFAGFDPGTDVQQLKEAGEKSMINNGGTLAEKRGY